MNKEQVFDVLRKILPNSKVKHNDTTLGDNYLVYLCADPLYEVVIRVENGSSNNDCLLFTNNSSHCGVRPYCTEDIYAYVVGLLADHRKFICNLNKELDNIKLVPYSTDTLYNRINQSRFPSIAKHTKPSKSVGNLLYLTYSTHDFDHHSIKYQPYICIAEQYNEALLCPPDCLSDMIPSQAVQLTDEFSILDHLKDMEQQVCKFFTKVHIGK